jgi:hypothetical protein
MARSWSVLGWASRPSASVFAVAVGIGVTIFGGTAWASGASPKRTPAATAAATPVYVNPLREVAGLQASRIDMGVDYSGSGPILALGSAKIVLATDRLAGPESCWGRTCVPAPGDMIVYRLLDGPFAGKYVYVVEHITITVSCSDPAAGRRSRGETSTSSWCGWARRRDT